MAHDDEASQHREVERKFAMPADAELADLIDLAAVPGVAYVGEPDESVLDATYYDTSARTLTAHDVSLRRRTGGADAGWHLKRPSRGGSADDRREQRAPLGDADAADDEVPAALALAVRALTRGRSLDAVVQVHTRRTERTLRAEDGRAIAVVADDLVTVRCPAGGGDGEGEDVTGDRVGRGDAGARGDHAEAEHVGEHGTAEAEDDTDALAETRAESVDGDQHDDDSHRPQSWHEVEVELVDADADPAFLEAITAAFAAAGITPASWPSKVRHALEVIGDEVVRALPARSPSRLGPKSPAADVALAHLRTSIEVINALDPAVREGDEDAVHDVRVATRRLRSAMASFRPLLDRTVTDPVRDELQWFGHVLGAVRDADVLGARLVAAARALPSELRLGPVIGRIDTELHRIHDRAHTELTTVLDEPRYFALLDALDALLTAPPLLADSRARAGRALPPLLAKEIRRVRRAGRAVDVAVTEGDEAARLAALHELRKSAKRARYAGEAVEVVLGKEARRLAARMEDLQDALGEHQDTVAARAELRRIGALVASHPEENGFTFGVLHEREARASEVALADLDRRRRRAT